jgi:alkyl hydroperoxide reductase subunit AhpF
MTGVDTTPATGDKAPDRDGPATGRSGVPVAITVVEAPVCHVCDDAKSTLAILAQTYPMTIHVLSIGSVDGGGLMVAHRALISPLVLLDGQYFSSGRLPRRKLVRALDEARAGEIDG